jgi:UDP-2-acetamido-2,6-beta-L-arabino-hexul-4-ose reductase
MKQVLVTGAAGFIGRNLVTALRRREDVALTTITSSDGWPALSEALERADVIYHLAGVNRPKSEEEFAIGNSGLTRRITVHLEELGRKPAIIIPSSIQAALDNPYGRSKKAAEEALGDYGRRTGAAVVIYRLPNVFGKWSRPNYNTVVATFCYNIARGLDIVISDPERQLELVYIDDVVAAFLRHLNAAPELERHWYRVEPVFRLSLGELAERIWGLHAIRDTLVVPDLADKLTRYLYATYLSFLPEGEFAAPIRLNTDNRGWLFELIKSEHFGQIFVSKTLPGVTRGDHYHDTKLEKFCVIQGEAVIRFRSIHSQEIIEYPVSGSDIRVVDIPPGYTHSIENTGTEEMICLFWANRIFSPQQPDTYWEKVKS